MAAETPTFNSEAFDSLSHPANTSLSQRGVLLSEAIICGHHNPCNDCVADPSLMVDYKDQVHLPTTPRDEVTGVTLLLHPDGASRDIRTYADDDHHSEHPKLHRELLDDAGIAVRKSRVQKANYWLHHIDNHETFRGPELATTREEKFRKVVFNVAGLIPELAICFKEPGNYYLQPLTDDQRTKIWQQGIVRVENSGLVREFIKQYLFDQDLTTISESDIDQFIHTKSDPIERWKQAKRILDAAAIEATDGITDIFKASYDRQLLPPKTSWRAPKFVVSRLANHEGEKSNLSKALQEQLKTRVGLAA